MCDFHIEILFQLNQSPFDGWRTVAVLAFVVGGNLEAACHVRERVLLVVNLHQFFRVDFERRFKFHRAIEIFGRSLVLD
jgi:hypothetical protein